MANNFCCTCIHWEQVNLSNKDSSGICDEVMVAMKVAIEKEQTSTDGTVWTNGYFGCIYWRENDGSLLNFEDVIDEDGKPINDD